MREVMAYVASTQRTAAPLYLTSFDVEIGQSTAFGDDEDVVAALFAALHAFGPPPGADAAREAAWRRALLPVVHCPSNADDLADHRDEALAAIAALDGWVAAIAPQVTAQRPPAHVAALRMIPENFRDEVELCTRVRAAGGSWQATRDELNAVNAETLRERLSATRKIILWAHHSHVAYDSTGHDTVSMGERLHARHPDQLYTIGLFAGGGRIIDGVLFGERELPSTRTFGVERLLRAVDRDAYFVDLKTLPTTDPRAGWLVEDTSRMESLERRPTILAKDFDGAIYIATVHPADFIDSVAGRWMLRALGFVEAHALGVGLVLVIGLAWLAWAIARAIVRRVRRWRASA